ncbi:hypothetical protein HYU10_05500 [Candidatus Woesearchaeota archaeon]|nr:hypothetical protein [Candidatus Woesearchaeota archaeon]
MKSRKSAVEMQFNWLFVMIIGGIILVTFLGFAMKQRDVSEDLTKSSIASSLDAIISSAQSSSGEVSVIKVPDEEMTFECNRIAVGNAAKQYENLILFSPKTIKSDNEPEHTFQDGKPAVRHKPRREVYTGGGFQEGFYEMG